MLNGLFAVEPGEWSAGAIIALLITNAAAIYQVVRKERRTDTEQDAGRDDTLVGQWRAYGKAMEKGRVDAVKAQIEAESRERKLISEVSRLAECVRQKDEQLREFQEGS